MASFAHLRLLWRNEDQSTTEGIPHNDHILWVTTSNYQSKVDTEIDNIFYNQHWGSLSLSPLSIDDTTLCPEKVSAESVAIVNTSKFLGLVWPITGPIVLKEISYASFCGIRNILVHVPHNDCFRHHSTNILECSRLINQALKIDQKLDIILLLPLVLPCTQCDRDGTPVDGLESWDIWNVIRSACQYESRLGVGLDLPDVMSKAAERSRSRWYSEPVKFLGLPSTTSKDHGGVISGLREEHRRFVSQFLRLKNPPWIGISKKSLFNGRPQGKSGCGERISPTEMWNKARQYFDNLQKTQPPRKPLEQYAIDHDWCDVPHRTLRTTTEFLRAWNYIEFERDPVKYELYQEAARRALNDWKRLGKSTSGKDGKVVIVVAGAGRGPLVSRALRAAADEEVSVDIWAVERNPDVYATLQRRNAQEWDGAVKVVCDDMRHWSGPSRCDTEDREQNYSVDIVISELIGNFADNGLSPECIDGVSSLLAPWGISIPCSYTSFITPIAAPKLHNHDTLSNLAASHGATSAHELPAATYLQCVDFLSFEEVDIEPIAKLSNQSIGKPNYVCSPDTIPVWRFDHAGSERYKPKKSSDNSHNSRNSKALFDIPRRGVCHGLAGYFECELYPGVDLSTNPSSSQALSPDMLSWFSMFFPFSTPITVADSSKLSVHMWRQTDGRSVWYEWMADASNIYSEDSKCAPLNVNNTRIHSSYGAAYRI